MRVFVAGATGVIGRRAVAALVSAGHDVTGIARTPRKAAQLRRARRRTGRGVAVRPGRAASRGRRARCRREPRDEDPVADPGRAEQARGRRTSASASKARATSSMPRSRRARVCSCRSRSRSCTASTATPGSTRRRLRGRRLAVHRSRTRGRGQRRAVHRRTARPRCRAALRCVPGAPTATTPMTIFGAARRGVAPRRRPRRMAIAPRSTPTTRLSRSCGPRTTRRPACTTSSTTSPSPGGDSARARSGGGPAAPAPAAGIRTRRGHGRSARRIAARLEPPASGTPPVGSRVRATRPTRSSRSAARGRSRTRARARRLGYRSGCSRRRAWRSAIYASFFPGSSTTTSPSAGSGFRTTGRTTSTWFATSVR